MISAGLVKVGKVPSTTVTITISETLFPSISKTVILNVYVPHESPSTSIVNTFPSVQLPDSNSTLLFVIE